MLKSLRSDLRTTVVAVVAASLVAGAPVVAHGVRHATFAHNADRIDRKNAVPFNAPLSRHKRALVARSQTTGPVPDSYRLDGFDSSRFLAGEGRALSRVLSLPDPCLTPLF
jgi:hypothetical protein